MSAKKGTRKSSKTSSTQIESPYMHIMDGMSKNDQIDSDLTFKINHHYRLTPAQNEFYEDILQDGKLMGIVDGPAGTAKTYLAILAALNMLRDREVDNIVYIRSIVESASRNLGALPGEIESKFAPWSMPLIDKLEELLPSYIANNLMNKNYISCLPVNFTRGVTFRNSCVVVDEAQNLTKNELVTILTRFGNNSKYIIVGDTNQSDIHGKSGFEDILNAFDHESCVKQGINAYQFTSADIVRSKVLRFIVERLSTIE